MPKLHAYEALVENLDDNTIALIDTLDEWNKRTKSHILFQTGDIVETERDGVQRVGWVVNLAEDIKKGKKLFYVICQDKSEVFQPAIHTKCYQVTGLRRLFYRLYFGRMERIK